MIGNSRKKPIAAVIISLLLLLLLLYDSGKVNASTSGDTCEEAAKQGVCVGEGAKCTIKKGLFIRFECGKDPDGQSIILTEDQN